MHLINPRVFFATSANQVLELTQLGNIVSNTANILGVQTNGTQVTKVSSFPADSAPATQNITTQDLISTSTSQANGQLAITGTPTAGSAASFAISSEESIEVQVTGTWTGTLATEVSIDSGTTWFARGIKQTGSSYFSNSFTANFEGGMNAAAVTNMRVRATAAMTGTATVQVISSLNAASLIISNPLTLRDATTQSIQNTIKAASTAPVSTDTALVVTMSPDSPGGAVGKPARKCRSSCNSCKRNNSDNCCIYKFYRNPE